MRDDWYSAWQVLFYMEKTSRPGTNAPDCCARPGKYTCTHILTENKIHYIYIIIYNYNLTKLRNIAIGACTYIVVKWLACFTKLWKYTEVAENKQCELKMNTLVMFSLESTCNTAVHTALVHKGDE